MGDEEWTAQFTYTPARAGTMYKRNGDPGDPPEPEEVELISLVKPYHGNLAGCMTLDPSLLGIDDYADIEQQCIDAAIEQDREEIESYYERHEYEQG
jgi:hypothetical protein